MPPKVQSPRFPSPLGHAALGLALLLALAACGAGEAPPNEPDAAEAPVGRQFGDAYEVVLGAHPAMPDRPPALADDTLLAGVRYAGGCEDHVFTLEHRTARDTAHLWLYHDAEGDDCAEVLYDDLRTVVPEEVLDAPVVVLDNPQGGEPFMLRWGDAAP